MSKRRAQVQADIDDNAPAAPPLPSNPHDVDHVIRLLEWGRRNGYAIGPTLQLGEVTLQVKDLRLARRESLRDGSAEGEPSIYAEHGMKDDDIPADGTTG